MTGSALMAQRLGNPFAGDEKDEIEMSKPGPIGSNGKKLKIKDMTKKKKTKEKRPAD